MLERIDENWTRLGKGKSSEVFRTRPGEVVKIFHSAVSEEMIEREMTAARLAGDLKLPTAAPLRRISVDTQPALVYPEIRGLSMSAAIRKRPLAAAALLDRMAALHRMIHSHAITQLRTVQSVLRTDIDYGPAPAALKSAAIAYLETLPDGCRLLHGDYHIDNIILQNGELVVLDWAKAAMGDPAADAVRSEMLMRFGAGPIDPVTNLWRDWAARRLMRAYRRQSDVTGDALARWRPVVALAWLRARPPVRDRAFLPYLNQALRSVNLPPFTP